MVIIITQPSLIIRISVVGGGASIHGIYIFTSYPISHIFFVVAPPASTCGVLTSFLRKNIRCWLRTREGDKEREDGERARAEAGDGEEGGRRDWNTHPAINTNKIPHKIGGLLGAGSGGGGVRRVKGKGMRKFGFGGWLR